MINFRLFALLFLLILSGCNADSQENKKSGNLSSSDKLKFQKYYVAGEQLYKVHCNNCHEDGKGLARLIPPLEDSDYFAVDSGKLICTIKFGLDGSVKVNGIEYNQPMPANMKLTNLEIATLTTYIYKEFQNQERLILPNAVNTVLEGCSEAK